jgi:plasmid stabilization system protein ParE
VRDPYAERRFTRWVKAAFASLCASPRRYPLWRGRAGGKGVRKRLVRKFPYAIPYLPDEDVAFVLAVAHHRRRPGYWLPRLWRLLRRRTTSA